MQIFFVKLTLQPSDKLSLFLLLLVQILDILHNSQFFAQLLVEFPALKLLRLEFLQSFGQLGWGRPV